MGITVLAAKVMIYDNDLSAKREWSWGNYRRKKILEMDAGCVEGKRDPKGVMVRGWEKNRRNKGKCL